MVRGDVSNNMPGLFVYLYICTFLPVPGMCAGFQINTWKCGGLNSVEIACGLKNCG